MKKNIFKTKAFPAAALATACIGILAACFLFGREEKHDFQPEEPAPGSIAQEWQDRVFPAGDSGGEAREPQTVGELLEANRLAIGYVYKGGQCTEYVFHRTPENIAYFLGSRPDASKIIVTDALDRLILDTVGNLIDTCPDQELLREVKKTLIPIQRGEAAAQPLFCPTMDEVDEYYEGQLAPESGQLQL